MCFRQSETFQYIMQGITLAGRPVPLAGMFVDKQMIYLSYLVKIAQ